MKLKYIDLSFYYEDKSEKEIRIDARIDLEVGWQQWGQPKDVLGDNVYLLEEITKSVGETLEQ
jgi:hypothetical protein